MFVHHTLRLLCVFLLISFLCIAHSPSTAEAKSLILATANTNGKYFTAGVAISTLLSSKLADSDNLVVTAINTTGSGENILLLAEGKCDLALLSGLHAIQAYRGLGFYVGRKIKNFSTIRVLWSNVEHYVVRNEYVKNRDISDLKGISGQFSIGMQDSGTIGSTEVIFESLELISGEDFKIEYLDYISSAEDILNKKITGAALTSRPPIAAVSKLFATAGDHISLMTVTDKQLNKINKNYSLWERYTIKAETYPGLKEDVQTISYPNLLVASEYLTDDEVYKIAKCISENLAFLDDSHHAIKAISLENSFNVSPIPIHPGAAKYYREVTLR